MSTLDNKQMVKNVYSWQQTSDDKCLLLDYKQIIKNVYSRQQTNNQKCLL